MDRKIKSFAVFINHAETVACLDDAMAGRLFKALFDYASNGTVPKWNDRALTAVFSMFKSQIDKSIEAYHEKCEKNAMNARKRYVTMNGNKPKAAEGGRLPSHTTASQRNRTVAAASECIPNGDNYNSNFKEEKLIDNTLEDKKIIVQEDITSPPEHDKTSQIDRSFDHVWAMYGKPVGNKTQLEEQWNGLSDKEREAILDYVPRYVTARPDPKYRKKFCNFLAGRTWETEQIMPTTYGKYKRNADTISQTRECARDDAARLTEELIAKCNTDCEETV